MRILPGSIPLVAPVNNTHNYANDAPPQTDLIKRVGMAAMPFISLFAPVPVSIAMSALRAYTSQDQGSLGKLISVVALAGTFCQHKIAASVTTAHDTLIEITKVAQAKTWEEASKSLFKISHNLIELTLLCQGGIPLSILAFSMRATVNLLDSQEEFQKGRWIEGVAQLLMGGVRMTQCHALYGQHRQQEAMKVAFQSLLEEAQHQVVALSTTPLEAESTPTHEVFNRPSDKYVIEVSNNSNVIISHTKHSPSVHYWTMQGFKYQSTGVSPVICIQSQDKKQLFLYTHIHHTSGASHLRLHDVLNHSFSSITKMTFNTNNKECFHPFLGKGKWDYDLQHWETRQVIPIPRWERDPWGDNGDDEIIHKFCSISLSVDFDPTTETVIDKLQITQKIKQR